MRLINSHDHMSSNISVLPLWILVSVLLLMPTSSYAAKMYKWVDADGNTHFSQTPPQKGQDKVDPGSVSVQQIDVAGLKPHESDGALYCGDLRLPRQGGNYPVSAERLRKRVEQWNRYLERSRKYLKRYFVLKKNRRSRLSTRRNSTTYNQQVEKLKKPIRQYQCAVNWANGKQVSARKGRVSKKTNYEKAKEDLAVAQNQQKTICGKAPPEYNKYGKARDRYLAWENCIRRNNAVVRRMEAQLRAAKRRLGKSQ